MKWMVGKRSQISRLIRGRALTLFCLPLPVDVPSSSSHVTLNAIQFHIRAPHSPSSAFGTTFSTAFGSTFNVSFCNWVIDYFWKISILFHKSTHKRLPFWPKTIPVNSPRFPGKFTSCAKPVPKISLRGF